MQTIWQLGYQNIEWKGKGNKASKTLKPFKLGFKIIDSTLSSLWAPRRKENFAHFQQTATAG